MEIQKICVAGGGRMGRQIAMCAAIYGVEANVYDLVEAVLTDVEQWADEYLAGRVAIGNTITVAASKTYWVLETESNSANKFGYKGGNQIS